MTEISGSSIMDYKGPSIWKRLRIWFRRAILRSHPEQTTRWIFKFNRTQIDDDLRRQLEEEIRKTEPAFRDFNQDGISGHEILAEEVGYIEWDQDKAARKWRRLRFTGRFWYGDLVVSAEGLQEPGEKGEFISRSLYNELVEKFYRMHGHRPF
jgi:hypothetical protein